VWKPAPPTSPFANDILIFTRYGLPPSPSHGCQVDRNGFGTNRSNLRSESHSSASTRMTCYKLKAFHVVVQISYRCPRDITCLMRMFNSPPWLTPRQKVLGSNPGGDAVPVRPNPLLKDAMSHGEVQE